ncbi:hypothetical protein C0Q70_07300 [Pomacea canaliculata]|uniref:Amino acid permease/ SLC12A domain-containing protein n=1 Tax=Pomacea canaliculata TaxID=400727 RepID=A0A2T7PEN8_POMCA|nr:hypothetical protein C0Q70_07300 [Pomacea canaliculata]
MADQKDTEEGSLLPGAGGKQQKKMPDWSRFGLSREQQAQSQKHYAATDQTDDIGQHNELFREDQMLQQVPWWKANFFISQPVLFGTWDGVFTSCLINILSVVIFLRMGWIVGNAGIGLSILTVLMSMSIILITALSAIGLCERCHVDSGGVYFLIAHILGARIGGSIGVLYCFAQAVGCSLSVLGFGESIMTLLGQSNPWIARGIAFGVVILLLESGFIGYKEVNFVNNSGPDFIDGENFFTIFGLFFATVTGILAGINMSGDLRDPFHNIPHGTLAALGAGYASVSITGVLWLAGLYLSSVSSCMGSLYGPPRILQSIANENVIPVVRFLGHGRGPNKVPVYALVVITLVGLLFICIGDVNSLAPVVTTAFLLTYAAVDYSYFALAMSYDKRQEREARFLVKTKAEPSDTVIEEKIPHSDPVAGVLHGTTIDISTHKDSFEKLAVDLDKLFPERLAQRGQHHLVRQNSVTNSAATTPDADFDATKRRMSAVEDASTENLNDASQLLGTKKTPNTEITKQPRSWYSVLCNRWLSLIGVILSFVIMFAIQWIYSLIELAVFFIIYFYIGRASPGYFPGIAEFNLYDWLKDCCRFCCGHGGSHEEQIVVAPSTPAVQTLAAQLTEDNEDFANRGRYHQSEVMQGDNFDDYTSD